MICNDVRVLALEVAPDFFAGRPQARYVVAAVIDHERAPWAQRVFRVRRAVSNVYLHIIQVIILVLNWSGDDNGVLEIWAIKLDSENH